MVEINYDFNILANRSNDKSKKWDQTFVTNRFGKIPDNYISMWIADLDFEVAPPIYRRFKEIIEDKSFGYVYPYEEFYQAIQFYLKRKTNRHVCKEEILLDYSIVSSLYHVAQTLSKAGGRVLINTPVYNPFREASERNQLVLVENELVVGDDKRYHIDFEKLKTQIVAERPDFYILCSPHNPGGKVWSKEELETIGDICIENDVILVVDEAHSDHIRNGEFTSVLSLDEKYLNQLIYLNSPNKPFNIAGLKTSFVVITNPTLRQHYQKTLMANHIDEPNIFGIAGLISAYTEEGLEWSQQSYAYILENYTWVETFMQTHLPQLDLMPLDATYVIWINVSKTGLDGDSFTHELAKETGVLVQEGSSFGQAGKDYIRINLGTSKEKVQEAFTRLAHWLEIRG